MCEIAVVDPEQANISTIHQLAGKFHEEQGDGLGVLMVKNDGDQFNYETYKSTKPHWQTLYSFLKRHIEDSWRVVVHGRAATAGDVNRQNAHPIHIDCELCDANYVVHNGSIRNHRNIRPSLKNTGHNVNTPVDSEIIGHRIQELPEEVDDLNLSTYKFRGNLNYLVCMDEGMLIRVSNKYHLSDDCTMTCSMRAFDDPEEHGFERGTDNEWMLVRPGEEGVGIETKERTATYTRTGNSAPRSGARWGGYASRGRTSSASAEDYKADGDTFTEEYVDHSSWDSIAAIKVAPGVMKVIDTEQDETEYVYRDVEPRLYYWYAPEPEPENIDQLERIAQGSQAELQEFVETEDNSDEEVAEEVVNETTSAIQEVVDISDEQLDNLQEQVSEQVKNNVMA